MKENEKKKWGSTEIWTRIAGFKVQSANHYTMEPLLWKLVKILRVFLFKLKKTSTRKFRVAHAAYKAVVAVLYYQLRRNIVTI